MNTTARPPTPETSAQAAQPLAPWLQAQAMGLLGQRGHAWLLQGPSGLGQWALGQALAQAWLCDAPQASGLACGQCPSCHAISVHTHADLCVLMPEAMMLAQGWPLNEKAQKEMDDKKRKPSKEIRIEAMRDLVEFAQRTSSRNRGKAVLIYPAERMNAVTANALLKTLEEPSGHTRFVLATEAAHQLLPTIRSRCIGHTLHWPDAASATQWLHANGLAPQDAATLCRAAGGRPDDALALAAQGMTAQAWGQLPRAAAAGHVAAFAAWSPAQAIAVLQKLCHDLQATKAAAAPRFFAPADLPAPEKIAGWPLLTQWSKDLAQAAQSCEHPYVPGLFLEDLLAQAARVLQSAQKVSKSARMSH